jgi:hypothetical protein
MLLELYMNYIKVVNISYLMCIYGLHNDWDSYHPTGHAGDENWGAIEEPIWPRSNMTKAHPLGPSAQERRPNANKPKSSYEKTPCIELHEPRIRQLSNYCCVYMYMWVFSHIIESRKENGQRFFPNWGGRTFFNRIYKNDICLFFLIACEMHTLF